MFQVNAENLLRAVSKVRLSFLRGLFWHIFLSKKSKLCLIGSNCKIIKISKLKMGFLAYIGDNSYVDCDCILLIELGTRATIREGAWIQSRSGFNDRSEGFKMGNYSYIGPYSVIGLGGMVEIGSGTQIGARFTISAENHLFDEKQQSYTAGKISRKGIRIGNNCWLGNNVSVLDGVEIGDNCVIGGGALVTKSIPPFSVAYGVPAEIKRSFK